LQKGSITNGNEVTVVRDLQYDLYAAVAAAKRGISCILDFNKDGENQSYLLDKKSGTVTPLIERKSGILEIPVHLYIDKNGNEKGLTVNENDKLSMSTVSKFWHGMDKHEFDPNCRANNTDELSLFMFDIIKSLNPKQRDYLIHARLAHLPRKAILQMIKNGSTGLPYEGKFKELCRPCLEAKHRAENHGHETNRHPEGKPGEYLHSDLAVVNLPDFFGYKYVLTVVDEITDEVVISLLKTKTAQTTLEACKKTLQLISARNGNIKLKSWQFDRGGEFLNDLFDEWIVRYLGAKQLFSNVEHPWENGRAERSFATIFAKARAMLKYADLPNGLWGRAVQHSAFLKNRCPSSRLNFLAPLQYRTGEAIDFNKLRVFGCPAQIFVKVKDRENNKLSSRSEKGTFIGMSRLGNGYIFKVERTNQIVEIDSADVKFNETFSDCRDRKGKIIKGGRVLDPDLINVPEATEPNKENETTTNEKSRFTENNYYSNLTDNDADSETHNDNNNEEEGSQDSNGIEADEIETQSVNSENESENDSDENKKNLNVKRLFKKSKFQQIKTNLKPGKNRKIRTKQTNEMKRIEPSAGFRSTPISTNKSQPNEIKSRRTTKPRDKFEPNFDPTYKRTKLALATQDDNDMTNLDPTATNYDQLMSCLEQNLSKEAGNLNDENEQKLHDNMLDLSGPDPKSQAAIDRLPADQRKRYNDATTKEFKGMQQKGVMENVRITDLPKGSKIYICIVNWVTKFVLGTYQKTKCRICFGGHHYVKTFTDCFAPTVNFCSVLIMICLAAMFGWYIGSLDYSQAYLNADIDEECFLRAPEFLREYDKDGIEFIWRLKKVIYGHPKGSRLWAECLNKKLKDLGFKQLATDQCVFAKWSNWNLKDLQKDSHFVFILVHSDDLIIISNIRQIMLNEKENLLKAFDGVDQGNLSSFCGVEVNINDNGITLSMAYYWDKIMKRFGISTDAKEDKPIKSKINKMECPATIDETRKKTYLQIIGSVIFGYTHCRLDLAFSIGMLTRIMHNPSEKHLKQLYGLLKYINATKQWGLNFYKDLSVHYGMDFTFFAFCDSSHADDESSFRSTGGWFFFLRTGQATISAKSGQTQDVALSSTEAETIWACSASTQGAFIKQFLDELQIFNKVSFDLHEDSMPAINAQRKNVSQSRFRHINIKYHYIRQLINDGWCRLVKIGTKEQVADLATKILGTDTTSYFSKIILGIEHVNLE
jgi:transposase InsO family protein